MTIVTDTAAWLTEASAQLDALIELGLHFPGLTGDADTALQHTKAELRGLRIAMLDRADTLRAYDAGQRGCVLDFQAAQARRRAVPCLEA